MTTQAEFRAQLVSSICFDSLAEFVEETSGYGLHSWQYILCKRLEKLATQKGQRILIHAPPQVGKSQIVSKRLPAWLVWRNKRVRIILAAYNKTHAGGLIESAKNATQHEVLQGEITWVKSNDDDGSFTKERFDLNDAQPNLIGVGLDSGFTGKNADLLVIDDPYPNAEDARSEAYNRKVRSFWTETAEPRLMANPDSNVVVMFHRYHEQDIAGFLLDTGIKWEVITFPAIADGNPNDPTNRELGEPLSPFHSIDALLAKQIDDPKTFAGQFQGSPLVEGERLFEPWMFEDRLIEPDAAPSIRSWFRGLDTAFTVKSYSDKSGTVKCAFDQFDNLILRGFHTEKLQPGDLTDWIEKLAGREQGTSWVVEMHNAGFAAVERLRRIGVPVIEQKIGASQGSKLQRAFILHDLCYRRKVFIVKEGHWQEFMTQLYSFTGDPKLKEKDDLIDPVTTVTTYLKESKSKYVNEERLIPNKYLIANPRRD